MPYSEGVAPYYDLFVGPADPPDGAAAFLSHFVERGGSVLDIGAGTGSTAIALAERGVHVTALEPDAEMHAVLLSRLARRFDIDARITPIPQGAGFPTGVQHDVVASFSLLHLLAPRDQDAVVAYARTQVKPQGKVVLEMPVVSTARVERPWSLQSTRSLGRARVEHHSAMNKAADGQWQTHWKFATFLDEVRVAETTRTFDWAPLTHGRAEELLSQNGLIALEDFAGCDRSPYVPGESRVRLVVARLG
jgi:SAM-dependent methyltransferase